MSIKKKINLLPHSDVVFCLLLHRKPGMPLTSPKPGSLKTDDNIYKISNF